MPAGQVVSMSMKVWPSIASVKAGDNWSTEGRAMEKWAAVDCQTVDNPGADGPMVNCQLLTVCLLDSQLSTVCLSDSQPSTVGQPTVNCRTVNHQLLELLTVNCQTVNCRTVKPLAVGHS